jgi:hypothetical protein
MSARALLKRMKIVLDQLRTNSYPAKNDILGKIRDEMDCSSRTFDRVIESLRDEFGCEILYDTNNHKNFEILTQGVSIFIRNFYETPKPIVDSF